MVAFYRVQVPEAETFIVVGCAMNVCFVDVASRSVSCIMRGPRLPCLFSFLQDLIHATFAIPGLTGQDQVFTPRQMLFALHPHLAASRDTACIMPWFPRPAGAYGFATHTLCRSTMLGR
jgi:hypothetical protein